MFINPYDPSKWFDSAPDDQRYHIIYITSNIITKRFYVGKHSTYKLKDYYLGSNKELKCDIKKYGRHNFIREDILFYLSAKDVFDSETNIVNTQFIVRDDTYNIQVGGSAPPSRLGCPMSETHKENTRLRMLGNTYGKENRELLSKLHTGMKHTEESKLKMSKSLKGKIPTQETKLKIRNTRKDKVPKHLVTSPSGEIFILHYNERYFYKQYKLSRHLFETYIDKGVIKLNPYTRGKTEQYVNSEGWEIKTVPDELKYTEEYDDVWVSTLTSWR